MCAMKENIYFSMCWCIFKDIYIWYIYNCQNKLDFLVKLLCDKLRESFLHFVDNNFSVRLIRKDGKFHVVIFEVIKKLISVNELSGGTNTPFIKKQRPATSQLFNFLGWVWCDISTNYQIQKLANTEASQVWIWFVMSKNFIC